MKLPIFKTGQTVPAHTAHGPVTGAVGEEIVRFLGVPYAAPPVGALRFAPPAPPAPWQNPLDCTRFRDSACQSTELDPGVSHSEDCLYLNIWAPRGAAPGSLPVLVYIHGGGFSDGSPQNPIYSGAQFAKNGVVQVNLTYRLNALGFMPFREIAEEYGNTGNTGLLDQIAALKWVRQNIAAFGGDPDRVTICGESAGSFSVSALLLSPLAKGLFTRAILESGNILGQPIVAPYAAGQPGAALAMAQAYAASLGAESLADMRRLDAKTIAAGSGFRGDLTRPNPFAFFPVFDGFVLPKQPYQALREGAFNPADILAGYNSDEGSLFVPTGASDEDYIRQCRTIFGADTPRVLARFPASQHVPARQRARELAKMGLRFGSDVYADEMSRRGQAVYCYNFNYRPQLLDAVGLGAMHALELLFVFDSSPKLPVRRAESLNFQRQVHHYWLNFVSEGDPNTGQPVDTPWPRYTAGEKLLLRLDSPMQPLPAPQAEEVAFFRQLLWE